MSEQPSAPNPVDDGRFFDADAIIPKPRKMKLHDRMYNVITMRDLPVPVFVQVIDDQAEEMRAATSDIPNKQAAMFDRVRAKLHLLVTDDDGNPISDEAIDKSSAFQIIEVANFVSRESGLDEQKKLGTCPACGRSDADEPVDPEAVPPPGQPGP